MLLHIRCACEALQLAGVEGYNKPVQCSGSRSAELSLAQAWCEQQQVPAPTFQMLGHCSAEEISQPVYVAGISCQRLLQ